MLLPDKHITVAESILGLGAFVLHELDRPRTIDQIHERVTAAYESKEFPAYHTFDSVILALLFLYAIGAIELTESGRIRQCDS